MKRLEIDGSLLNYLAVDLICIFLVQYICRLDCAEAHDPHGKEKAGRVSR